MNADFVVIGGGVIGLRIARELKRRYPDGSVMLLEKEEAPGRHASGLNSGVLHAGFYYTADSLKARFTRQGNAQMQRYCEEHGLRINRCGKLVVARRAAELDGLDELKRRGDRNGVPSEVITEAQARAIEPRVRTFERALFSPTTATVDPAEVVRAFAEEAQRAGVDIRTGAPYLERRGTDLLTGAGRVSAGYVVNAAGLYADRVARDFGCSESYRILPFKGLYLYSREPPGALRTNIYPVPDLRNPFLGVHFTLTVDGHAKIGPTAIPALWREHYRGLHRFRFRELCEVVATELRLLARAGFDFRGLAWQEVRKYFRPYLVRQAAALAEGVRPEDYVQWGPSGIRAQLLNTKTRTLVMDFLLEGDARSLHVLNAVSPAFTCCIPFAAHVCDEIARLAGNRR
jgi:L-2-hydroxyglutarate oxidase LhgO